MGNTHVQDDRISRALVLPETEELDFKRVGNVAAAAKTAVAMANTRGGWLVLGIDDPRKRMGIDRLFGLEEKPEALGELIRYLQVHVVPPLAPPSLPFELSAQEIPCTLRNGALGRIALLRIPASNAVHSLVEGPTYIRVPGPQDRQLVAAEVTELSLRRGVRSVVDQPCTCDWSLLETAMWREYADQRRLTRSLPEALPHLGLTVKSPSGAWEPKMAAALLFAEHPGDILGTKAAIRIFHYRGHVVDHGPNTNLVHTPVTVDGPILHQVREAARLVVKEISGDGGVQVTMAGFSVRQGYPPRVIQEAITNAVLHRDYRITQDIHIRIFANRIEVESPGGFPGAITPENIGKIGSRPRNATLVNHLREFPVPPNLDAGEGVPMMMQTLQKAGLFPPLYRLVSHPDRESVLVILKNEAKNNAWQMVEDHLRTHGQIGNADLRCILNLTERQHAAASKQLAKWVADGALIIINPEAGTRSRAMRFHFPQSPILCPICFPTQVEHNRR